jgi:hypothetical protein
VFNVDPPYKLCTGVCCKMGVDGHKFRVYCCYNAGYVGVLVVCEGSFVNTKSQLKMCPGVRTNTTGVLLMRVHGDATGV